LGKELGMSRCPVCRSVRIVIVVSPERRAFCTSCGARWIQEGSEQRSVKTGILRVAPAGQRP
jgi:transposase-like protein